MESMKWVKRSKVESENKRAMEAGEGVSDHERNDDNVEH